MRKINGTLALTLTVAMAAGIGTALAQTSGSSGSSGVASPAPSTSPSDTMNQGGTYNSNDTTKGTGSSTTGIENQSGHECSGTFEAYTVDKVTSKKVTLRPFAGTETGTSGTVEKQSGKEITLSLDKFQSLANSGSASGTSGTSATGNTNAAATPKVGDKVCVAMGSHNRPSQIMLMNDMGTTNQRGIDEDTGINNGSSTPLESPAPSSTPSSNGTSSKPY